MNIVEKVKAPFTQEPVASKGPGDKYALFSQSSRGPLIIMAFSIFILEAMVMFFFSFLPAFHHGWLESFLDAGLLVALLSPTLYFFLFRPLARHIAERKRAEGALRKASHELERRVEERTHELGERVKELNCLYGISNLVEKEDISFDEILQGTVDLIPPGWQYPEVTCGRITVGDQEFETENCIDTIWKQSSDIIVHGETMGNVEVCYLEEKPEMDEGPFLKEERSLINAISERLGNIIETTRAKESLAWESNVNEALSDLYAPLISSSSSIEDMTGIILDRARILTKSEHGYVSSIEPHTGHSICHTLSEMMGDLCKVSDENKTITFPRGEDGTYHGLWGHSLNTSESFYSNSSETHSSSKGLPDGHIPLKRFLSVPVMLGEKLVGQIALANKEEDYTDQDLEAVRRLAEFYALAIQRIRVEEALQQAHDLLERRVEERTRELEQSNKRLTREIEERTQTEEELLQAKTTLQSVFDGISDPLVMMDNTLSIVMLNEAAEKFYRVSDHDDVIGKICYETMKGGSEPCEGCEVPHAISSGKRKMFERRGLMDPERMENVVVYPIKGKTGNGTDAILHVRDITEKKLFEKQLIQSEKLASLGILVSSIGHEINNPNSFILFNTPILKDYLGELMPIVDIYAEGHPDLELLHMPYPEFRADLHRLLDNIEHGTIRIDSVVANLREFSRGKDMKEEKWINLKSVIEKALAMSETKIRKTVKSFVKKIPEDLPKIYSDPHALEQILINLLINAVQASDKKDSRVELSVASGNSWLDKTIIRVGDNGCGIDDKTRDHIFDPFFTSKSRSDGTGLGLYVTHNLVSSLRGRIELQSEPGEGSTFSVILPDKERRQKKRD